MVTSPIPRSDEFFPSRLRSSRSEEQEKLLRTLRTLSATPTISNIGLREVEQYDLEWIMEREPSFRFFCHRLDQCLERRRGGESHFAQSRGMLIFSNLAAAPTLHQNEEDQEDMLLYNDLKNEFLRKVEEDEGKEGVVLLLHFYLRVGITPLLPLPHHSPVILNNQTLANISHIMHPFTSKSKISAPNRDHHFELRGEVVEVLDNEDRYEQELDERLEQLAFIQPKQPIIVDISSPDKEDESKENEYHVHRSRGSLSQTVIRDEESQAARLLVENQSDEDEDAYSLEKSEELREDQEEDKIWIDKMLNIESKPKGGGVGGSSSSKQVGLVVEGGDDDLLDDASSMGKIKIDLPHGFQHTGREERLEMAQERVLGEGKVRDEIEKATSFLNITT